MDVITVPSPDSFLRAPGESEFDHARRMFAPMEAAIAENHGEVAAVIVEPLVQCAGGMRMYDPEYLRLLRAACTRFGVHLIADEIAVGFGRTGTMFACEQAGITPDYLCLSKGLTGGYLPLSVVLTSDVIYDAFYDEYTKLNAFLHSHSYTGNPLACAAANATLAIFREEPVLDRNRVLARKMADSVAHLADHPHVVDIRQRGMILAVELMKDPKARTPWPWTERRGLRIYRHALERGALIRPLGTTLYFMPPYVIEPAEIETLARIATEGVELACA
jgi:adenosylmethionine-8-amino-7-oxononanoate aminotransferase